MNDVLVVGGAGYVGSHTCKELSLRGFRPVTFDNLSAGREEFVKWGPFIEGDLSDRSALAAAFQRYRFSAVLHFAAYAYVGESVRSPEKYYYNNVVGTLNLLAEMRSANVSNLVFSSSCAVYGVPAVVPIPLDSKLEPVNPYGATKMMVEKILYDYGVAYGLRSISLRYFNAAGAADSLEIGEAHHPETHLIPLAIKSTESDHSLVVFGDDYPTPDGTCIRDYVHVSDLAAAHVSALALLKRCERLDGPFTRAFNLGTGRGHSVREVIASVERVSGRKVNFSIGRRRAGDPAELVADPGATERGLGWTAQHINLDEIISSAFRWHIRET
jgi:UDP-glucose-4-epimerase GalE